MTSAVDRFQPAAPDLATTRFDVLADIRAGSPVAFVPAIGMWAVTGYDQLREVLGDPLRFRSGGSFIPSGHLSAEVYAAYPADGPLWQHSMVATDGEQHRRLRGAMAKAFTARRVHDLEPVIAADAEHLLTRMFADGADTTDLLATFARPLPSRTIARFFGLPVGEAPRFSGWSDAFVVPQVPGLPVAAYVQAAEQFAAFDAYLREIITGDPDGLGDGIIRTLVEGRRDGSHDLTEDELVGDIGNVVFAGHETTVATLANIFVRLLRDRELWASLAAGSAEIGPLVEELLRLDTSGIGLFRVTDTATRLGGVDLPAHAKLWVSFGAANRDPAEFDDPDLLNPGRPRAGAGMTFGHGIHACIGAALARTQVRIAVSSVPAAFPELVLSGEVHEVPNYVIRAVPQLPVTRLAR